MKVVLLLDACKQAVGKAVAARGAGKGTLPPPTHLDPLWVATCADAAKQAAAATLAGDTSMFLHTTRYLHGAARRAYQDAYYASLNEQATHRVPWPG
jgi:hypothetical protein